MCVYVCVSGLYRIQEDVRKNITLTVKIADNLNPILSLSELLGSKNSRVLSCFDFINHFYRMNNYSINVLKKKTFITFKIIVTSYVYYDARIQTHTHT